MVYYWTDTESSASRCTVETINFDTANKQHLQNCYESHFMCILAFNSSKTIVNLKVFTANRQNGTIHKYKEWHWFLYIFFLFDFINENSVFLISNTTDNRIHGPLY